MQFEPIDKLDAFAIGRPQVGMVQFAPYANIVGAERVERAMTTRAGVDDADLWDGLDRYSNRVSLRVFRFRGSRLHLICRKIGFHDEKPVNETAGAPIVLSAFEDGFPPVSAWAIVTSDSAAQANLVR